MCIDLFDRLRWLVLANLPCPHGPCLIFTLSQASSGPATMSCPAFPKPLPTFSLLVSHPLSRFCSSHHSNLISLVFPSTSRGQKKKKGKRTIFVTNNSTRSRAENHKKLSAFSIPGTIDDMFGASYASAIYITRVLSLPANKRKVFVVGEAGIEAELAAEGIVHLGGTDPAFQQEFSPQHTAGLVDGSALDPEVGVVLCGLDFHMSYLKLATAYRYVRAGALFLSTNPDKTFTMSHQAFPAAGACTASLSYALGGQQPLLMGKPSQAMMESVQGKYGFDKARTCMVGDSLDTDIRFGNEGGLAGTLHVLSGVSKREDWERQGAPVVPKYFANSMADLGNGEQ